MRKGIWVLWVAIFSVGSIAQVEFIPIRIVASYQDTDSFNYNQSAETIQSGLEAALIAIDSLTSNAIYIMPARDMAHDGYDSNGVPVHMLDVVDHSRERTLLAKAGEGYSQGERILNTIQYSGCLLAALASCVLVRFARRRKWLEKQIKRKTYELQECKAYQKVVLASVSDITCVKDKEIRIVDANPGYLGLYPITMRHSIIGKKTSIESNVAAQSDDSLNHDREAFAYNQLETYESKNLPSGTVLTLFSKKVRYADRDSEPFILSVSQDVSEKENLVRQLERSSKEFYSFLYTVSHDLKESLRGIYGHASLVQSDFADRLD